MAIATPEAVLLADNLVSNDYASLVLRYPDQSLFTLFLLGLCRLLPIIAFSPFLGSKIAPPPVKVGLGISLFLIMMPHVLLHTSAPIPFDLTLLFLGVKEALIGFIMGFIITVPFYIAESAGIIIDFQRGSSSLTANDPTISVQASPLGLLYNYTSIVIFFAIGGPFIFFQAIMKSYVVIPPDRFPSVEFFMNPGPFWNTIIGLMAYILGLSVQLGAPALLTILMTDTFLGIANRLAPQVQITFLGQALKALAGTAVLIPMWWLLIHLLNKYLLKWFTTLDHVIDWMG